MGTTTQTTLINNYSARNNTASGKEDRGEIREHKTNGGSARRKIKGRESPKKHFRFLSVYIRFLRQNYNE